MAKYKKKPVVIEAYQTDVEEKIVTLEGTMIANVGDWIITGINGEKYPCKPDIFEKTYELVEMDQKTLETIIETHKNGEYVQTLKEGVETCKYY